MEDIISHWIYLIAVTMFLHETGKHVVDAYYFNSRCVGTECISYMGSKLTYDEASDECSSRWNGHVVYFDYSSESDRDRLWTIAQMTTDGKTEIWMGAKLISSLGNGRVPQCNILRGPDNTSSSLRLDTKRCRQKIGVVCMKDISAGCPYGFKQCGQKCFKYVSGRHTWQRAREECRALGAEVDMFDPQKVQLQDYYECYQRPRAGQKAWVKGSQEEIQWSDGQAFDPKTQFTFWMDSEPSKEAEKQCISFTNDMGWKMRSCDTALPFACFYDKTDPFGRNPPAPESPADDVTTAAPPGVEMGPDPGNTEEGTSNALMFGLIALAVVMVVAIIIIIIGVLVMLRRRQKEKAAGNLGKASSYGSVLSNSSTRYLVEPTAPPNKEGGKISTISNATNYYESIDDTKVPGPVYQDLQAGHNHYAHPYTDLDFTEEQNRRNERLSPPESPPAYDEPYADKRRLPRLATTPAENVQSSSGERSPGPRHVTFGGIETPLAKVASSSPKTPRGSSPKIPRPTVASPRIRPPPVLPKSYNEREQPKSQDNTVDNSAAYNQSQHSYLELLPHATPEELESVRAKQAAEAQAKSSGRSQQKPRKKGPESPKKTESGGDNVRQKAKALEGKFKLSTSPTLGRQKLTDGKNASVLDGDVFQK